MNPSYYSPKPPVGIASTNTGYLKPLHYQDRNYSHNGTVAQAYTPIEQVMSPVSLQNPNTFRYNNIDSVAGLQSVREYVLDIDSATRNVISYPDPFSYAVKYTTEGSGLMHLAPILSEKLCNVKYVKLLGVQLPKYYAVDLQNPDNPQIDTTKSLISERFIQLDISINDRQNEIITTRGNSVDYRKSVKLYNKDPVIDNSAYFWATPSSPILYYFQPSNLESLTDIRVSFSDSEYQPIHFNNLNSSLNKSSLASPMNKTYQSVISLAIGVQSVEVNNMPDFTKR